MEFNKWYHYWFEHRGFCPGCGKYMAMSIGCTQFTKCPLAKKAMKKDKWIKLKVRSCYGLRRDIMKKKKQLDDERKRKNLDTSEKKHYSKIDN